ncbi:MAG: ADP-forming succinate--CoA ligase subunit beta [Flavobacteriales bacterium]|nr:ADP-forming succinate--CoA ligase subunit beta [Flavobacteriales bacterium]
MNLHEYQGKTILNSFGVAIQEGLVADSAEAAHEAALKLAEKTGTEWFVLKAQIHAGGRGKGTVTETGSHGVVLAKGIDKVKDVASGILGGHLVTAQTSAEGKMVNKILVAQDVYYPGESETEEFYVSVLLDRSSGKNIIMYSPEGGMDIEAVAEKTPHLIYTETIDPGVGLQGFQARRIAFNLGLSGMAYKQMSKFIFKLYDAYVGCDASMFEINPVLKTSDNKIIAVDSKVSLDDNALYRHPEYAAMRDISEEDPTELEADKIGLNYVKLNGNVGCMVNGAGLAMATMDIIKLSGGEPANFLDVGGTADATRVEQAFRIILQDKAVKAILVNIFGGIVRCDRVAQGVVDAYKNMENIDVPIIVRLQGTNAMEAKKLIDESGLEVTSVILLQEAADAVAAVVA